jgi:hypothetical protein
MQHSHPRQHFDRLLRENNNTYVKIHTVGNLYLKYKMSTSHKSIETTAKVMLHEFFDAQISAEHIVCVICSVDDCSVCTGSTLSFLKDWELARKKNISSIFQMFKGHLDKFSLPNSSTFGLIPMDS